MNEMKAVTPISECRGTTWRGLPAVTKGRHDFSANCVRVAGPNGGDVGALVSLAKDVTCVALFFFALVCSVLGALLLARAVHDGVMDGWSWRVVIASISDRLGPA